VIVSRPIPKAHLADLEATARAFGDDAVLHLVAVYRAAMAWSDQRDYEHGTFSSSCMTADKADQLQALLKGMPVPADGERAAARLSELLTGLTGRPPP
jgi:hypothetical protein